MKSAHKLAAALAILVALLVAAYFILTALQSSPGHNSTFPSSPGTTATEAPSGQPSTATTEPTVVSTESMITKQASQETPSSGDQSIVRTLEVQTATTVFKQPEILVEIIQPVKGSSSPVQSELEQSASSRPIPVVSSEQPIDGNSDKSSTESPIETSSSTQLPSSTQESSSTTVTTTSEPPIKTPTTSSFESEEPKTTTTTTTSDSVNSMQMVTDSAKLYKEITSNPTDASNFQLSPEEEQQWQVFKRDHAKIYSNLAEEKKRAEIFSGNLRFINSYNRQSGVSFRLGVNKFADLHRDEINAIFVGPTINWTQTLGKSATSPMPMRILSDQDVQTNDVLRSADWRNLTTGDPPDQGTCRESALFAVVASLEATLNAASTTGNKVRLSETQLLDCLALNAPPPPNWPPVCAGHLSMVHILDFLQRQSIRLATQQEYNEFKTAQKAGLAPNQICVPAPQPPGRPEYRAKVGSYGQVHRDNIDEALINRGPLIVALDASQPTFHFYKSGIYHELACSPESYNLHTLLMAYAPATQDGDTNQAHYTIRSSFGPDWGEQGHMRLLKDPSRNKCLPQHLATYPNIAYEW